MKFHKTFLNSFNLTEKVISLCCLLASLSFALLIFVSSIPKSVLSMNMLLKANVQLAVPQGWSFFTKSPRDSFIDLYEISQNGQVKKVDARYSSPTSWYGLTRKGAFIQLQTSIIEKELARIKWIDPTQLDTPRYANYYNYSKINLLKGDRYAMVQTTPVPYSWRNSKKLNRRYKIKLFRLKNCL
jgi:Sporulation delaying protein SdpA